MGYVVMNPNDDLSPEDGADTRAPRRLSIAGVSHASMWSSAAWNSNRSSPLKGDTVEVNLERVHLSAFSDDDIGALEVQLVQLLRHTGLETFTPPGVELSNQQCNSFQLVINDEVVKLNTHVDDIRLYSLGIQATF